MKLIFGLVAGLTLSTAALAQSYIIRPSGVVLTVDTKGFLYDLNQFILPYMVTVRGGQFYINDKREITTVSEEGFFFRIDKKEFEAPRKVDFSGANYFSDSKRVWTVDSKGVMNRNSNIKNLKNIGVTGGKFFTVNPKRDDSILYTINEFGQINRMLIDGLDPAQIRTAGGNWFTTSKGELYSLNQKGDVILYDGDGFEKGARILRVGGNYLVTAKGILTISTEGVVSQVDAPSQGIKSIGYNYFTLRDDSLYVVDGTGGVWNNTAFGNLGSLGMTSLQ